MSRDGETANGHNIELLLAVCFSSCSGDPTCVVLTHKTSHDVNTVKPRWTREATAWEEPLARSHVVHQRLSQARNPHTRTPPQPNAAACQRLNTRKGSGETAVTEASPALGSRPCGAQNFPQETYSLFGSSDSHPKCTESPHQTCLQKARPRDEGSGRRALSGKERQAFQGCICKLTQPTEPHGPQPHQVFRNAKEKRLS